MNCLTIEDFAVQAGMVAVETYIDVGNILWIFYDWLCIYIQLGSIGHAWVAGFHIGIWDIFYESVCEEKWPVEMFFAETSLILS